MTPPFTASMRWRSISQAGWEIDTEHGGFRSAEEAALWANGLSGLGPKTMYLSAGAVWIELNNGQRLDVGADLITIWRCPDEDPEMGETAFERFDRSLAELSASGLDGAFVAQRFKVSSSDGPLDIRVTADPEQSRVLLSLGEPAAEEEDSSDLFGRIPRA